jgi:hypothetical protein
MPACARHWGLADKQLARRASRAMKPGSTGTRRYAIACNPYISSSSACQLAMSMLRPIARATSTRQSPRQRMRSPAPHGGFLSLGFAFAFGAGKRDNGTEQFVK